MFMGEFSCKIDNKGRIMLPVKFREQIGDMFVITRGLDNCIDVFPMDEWKIIEERLRDLKMTNSKHRAYQRFVLSAATKINLDTQGRINLPTSLISHANIEKNVIVTGSNNHLEIWSEEKWNSYIDEKIEVIEEIADEIDF